jgi:hypothetical protein
VPGLDTTAIRIGRGQCYSAAVRKTDFFKGGKLVGHAMRFFEAGEARPGKTQEILYNPTCSGISRNLKEFRSGAIRMGGHEPGAL